MRGRIILQALVTCHYLTPSGAWVAGCRKARRFEHTYLALLEGLDHRDRATQVVWCFSNPSLSLLMPVHASDDHRVFACATCPAAPHTPNLIISQNLLLYCFSTSGDTRSGSTASP